MTIVLAAPAAWAQKAQSFDVFEYRVQGNSVLPGETIERAVYPFLGEGRSINDVEAARSALEKAYREAGFGTVLVDVPEQKVDDAVVTLQVLEAPVARLRVVGAQYYSQQRILDKVPGLAEGRVPNFTEVQQQLASVNTGPDRKVTPLLRPGKAPGTTEVDLQEEDKLPLHGSKEMNNRQSPDTTAMRLQASLRYDNLWQRDHSLGVQFQVSPQDPGEVRALAGTYTVPAPDGAWVFSGVLSNSNVVSGVGDTTVLGKGSIVGVRRIVVLDGSERLTQSMSFGVDYKNFRDTVAVNAGTAGANGFATPIHYLPFNVGYSGTLDDPTGRWLGSAGLNFALRVVASDEAQFADKRFGASSGYSSLKLDLAREQKLPGALSLFGRLDGQLAGRPLVANEQFVAGGVDSVRGYLEAAAAGDAAIHGSLELRSPNLAGDRWPGVGLLELHAFAEGAHLVLRDPLPSQRSAFSLLGAGFGMRVKSDVPARTSLALDLGWPLRALGETQRGDLRVHASGAVEF